EAGKREGLGEERLGVRQEAWAVGRAGPDRERARAGLPAAHVHALMPAPAVGETFGPYRIDSLLGRGGMGTVYLATHTRLDRKVALNVIAPAFAGDEGFRERFLRESQLAASLDHPYPCDFGLAKRTAAAGATVTGSFLGSVDYAPPEQIEGRPLDGRADVYALGAVVFHCLTGRPPFRRDSEFATLRAHLDDEPPG